MKNEAFFARRMWPSACMLPVLLFLFAIISCNGNGLAFVYDGESYSRSDYGTSPSSAPGGSQVTSDDIPRRAGDILELANSGDTDRIKSLFGSGGGTTDITLSSVAIGLPAGGYVTLSIIGDGISYVADSYASSDGKVHFTVPEIADGTSVTVTIVVRDAAGNVECSGSKTKTVTGASSLVDVTLTGRQTTPQVPDEDDDAWTLPDPLTVSAFPTSVDYNPLAVPAQTVRLELLGLTDPPSGSLHYAWTNAANMAIGTDSKVIELPVTDIIGAAASSLPAGESVLIANLALTYTDEDGNIQTRSASCPVRVTIHKIPGYSLVPQSPLPAGMELQSALSYTVADLSQTLTVTASPAAGSSFSATGTSFAWTVNGSDLLDASGNPVSSASAPIRLSDFIPATSLGTASPVPLVITCTVSDDMAVNSPVPAVSETLNFYKPSLSKPVIDAPTTGNGNYIGVTGTEYSFYALSSGSPYDTNLRFSTSTSMPAGTTFNWRVNGSSLMGDSGPASVPPPPDAYYALGTWWTSAMPATLTVTCEAICAGYDSVVSDPITVKVLSYPSSVPSFHTAIDSYPGQQYMSGTHCYDVVDDSIIGMKLFTNGVPGAELPANGTASFEWKANGVTVKTTTTQEANLNVGEVLAALGTGIMSLTDYNSTDLAPPSGGLEIEIQCTVTVTVSGATGNGDTTSSYETSRKLVLYR